MKKKFTFKAANTVEPPAPTSVWGYKGCPGKGKPIKNHLIERQNETIEKENVNHG